MAWNMLFSTAMGAFYLATTNSENRVTLEAVIDFKEDRKDLKKVPAGSTIYFRDRPHRES